MFARSCEELAETHRAFADMTFTPHDFRGLFATEIVNGGLHVHISAALLGHLNLQTLQGYVAVFAEDIVANYQRFLNHCPIAGDRIPRSHTRGVGRLRGALRQAQGRTRQLRSPLRHPLQPRTRLLL
ncbi:tyrosine-type recombinase/integrase [Streptomyces tendae]|uniref:tyrosine-type recombinase/integrase n=1 Tax=Streptomyces tendae TaxID=1932 RepID=UPI003674840F